MSLRLFLRRGYHQYTQLSKQFNRHGSSFLESTSKHRYSQHYARQTAGHTTTTLLIIGGCLFGGSIAVYCQPNKKEREDTEVEQNEAVVFENDQAMVGNILPGRPGNLTPDQEEKLQEFWKATLKVFGVAQHSVGGPDTTIEDGDSHSEAGDDMGKPTPDKKKKKRLGLFKRKDKGEKDPEVPGGFPTSTDADDKYGQTKDFQQALASQSPEDLRAAFWSMVKHDHPDGLLLRFLRARKWDVEKALVMLISTMHWRAKEMHVDDDIMKNGEIAAVRNASSSDASVKKEGEDFLAQMRLGKSFLHGTDKDGRPMCFVRVRLHRQGEQSEQSLERYTVYVIETARLLLSPPADTAAIVFDMTGFSMANMDYTPVKFMIKCFEANYPESLGAVLVHKAPWVFQGIWTIIKGWLDPVVASKVHFTSSVKELENYVPKDHIIKELGGDDPWEYKYVEPVPGEDEKMSDNVTRQQLQEERVVIVKEFESVTQEWMQRPKGDAALMTKRNELAAKLRTGYWQLDPYIRARSYYDRTGVKASDGRTIYYPTANKVEEKVAEKVDGPTPAAHNVDDLD